MTHFRAGLLVAVVSLSFGCRDVPKSAERPPEPQIGYEASAVQSKGLANTFGITLPPGQSPLSTVYLGDANMTWEIDLWGRIRRSSEAATAQLFASEERRRAVLLSLVSDVAQAYFELIELDALLTIAREVEVRSRR